MSGELARLGLPPQLPRLNKSLLAKLVADYRELARRFRTVHFEGKDEDGITEMRRISRAWDERAAYIQSVLIEGKAPPIEPGSF